MVTRIHDMPVYETRTEELDAAVYNLWRRARLHLTMPLRIELPELKQMALIVENDCWVLVDQCQYDLPVMAWLDFQDSGRSTLHTPVTCTLNYYHYLASHLQQKVLALMSQALETRLIDADFIAADSKDEPH